MFSKKGEQNGFLEQSRDRRQAGWLWAFQSLVENLPFHYTEFSHSFFTTSFNRFQLQASYKYIINTFHQNLILKKMLLRLYKLICEGFEGLTRFIFQDILELEVLIQIYKSKEWKFQATAGRRQGLLENGE